MTLQRCAQLPDPKPQVVGSGWVAACAEQVQALEPEGFKVDVAVASAEARVREKRLSFKKRESVLPVMDFRVTLIAPGKVPAYARDREDGDDEDDGDEDDALPGGVEVDVEEEDITLLEWARRRREWMERRGRRGAAL